MFSTRPCINILKGVERLPCFLQFFLYVRGFMSKFRKRALQFSRWLGSNQVVEIVDHVDERFRKVQIMSPSIDGSIDVKPNPATQMGPVEAGSDSSRRA